MPRSAASSGETSTKVDGRHGLDAGGAIGHAALLEVFEEAAVVEMEVGNSFIGFEAGRDVLDGIEAGLAVGEVEFLGEEQRRVCAVGGDGPLQALVAFQALVVDAREDRGEAGDLVHDVGGVRVVPVARPCGWR